jgi:hypothetical protein
MWVGALWLCWVWLCLLMAYTSEYELLLLSLLGSSAKVQC